MNKCSPPRIAEALLEKVLPADLKEPLLGDLEEELGNPDQATAILLAPKMYYVGCLPEDNPNIDPKQLHSKVKVKGVCLHRDRLISEQTSTDHHSADMAVLHEIYNGRDTDNPATVIDNATTAKQLFERIRDEGTAHVICSQLTKKLVGGDGLPFSLSQRYLFKKLS